MDDSNTGNVRYNVTWQAQGDTFVELEITGGEKQDHLRKAVVDTIALVLQLEGKMFVTSEKEIPKTYCLEITFDSDEKKRLFLKRLPTVQ